MELEKSAGAHAGGDLGAGGGGARAEHIGSGGPGRAESGEGLRPHVVLEHGAGVERAMPGEEADEDERDGNGEGGAG